MTETRSIFPDWYFDPETVAWRAVREIIQELARLPVTRPHTVSEVVVDTVTRLFWTVMDDGEETSNQAESSRFLSGVAVGATVTVLHDLHPAECRATQDFLMQYSRSAMTGMVSVLHRKLLEHMGSPEALKVALRRKCSALSSTITTAITAAIRKVLTPPDTTSPGMLVEQRENDIATPTELVVLEVQQQLKETEMDIVITPESAMDITTSAVTTMDIVITPETVMDITTSEVTTMDMLDVVEPSGMQDRCVVVIPLDNAEGDDSQLEDLPQKIKKPRKTGIRRFFSRVWKTLKESCCCCCVETD